MCAAGAGVALQLQGLRHTRFSESSTYWLRICKLIFSL